MVRVDVIVPLCVVWLEFLEAIIHKTKGPLHLKEYFVNKAFSEKMGFQANIFSATQEITEESSNDEIFRHGLFN